MLPHESKFLVTFLNHEVSWLYYNAVERYHNHKKSRKERLYLGPAYFLVHYLRIVEYGYTKTDMRDESVESGSASDQKIETLGMD